MALLPLVSTVLSIVHCALAAAPDSPSGNYTPTIVICPAQRPTIRDASVLSPQESAWLQVRRPNTVPPMVDFFKLANIPDFNAVSYINSNKKDFTIVPNIAIAVSGGGTRSLLNGGGVIAATDNRVPGSTNAGGIGGLLQAATYLGGNSGGGWLVGSIYANNFSTIPTLRDGSPGSGSWQFSSSISEGPAIFPGPTSGSLINNATLYWTRIQDQISGKQAAGFNISLSDYWGRALSYQLINDVDGGPAYTFSSIANADGFLSGEMPMPIIVSDELEPGATAVSSTSPVYEFNPFEMGSFAPSVFGFVPTKFIGSGFNNGIVPQDADCVEGFDQYGLVFATTSFLFNEAAGSFKADVEGSTPPNILAILDALDQGPDGEVTRWQPNPFFNFNPDTNANANSEILALVDGGEDFENLPLLPLLQPLRAVDVIVAIDSSGDTSFSYPNGSALRHTLTRTQEFNSGKLQFPDIPDADTFINLGLNQKPTFFGCNASDFTGAIPPLIVWIPLAPYSAFNNASTVQPTFSNEQRQDFIENGFNVGTMGNGTVEAQWPACLACAILSRSLQRTSTPLPASCESCFETHCWNGTIDTTPAIYNPTLILGSNLPSATSKPGNGPKLQLALNTTVA
ncbi:lysophospholipase [Xylaria intraflava]|nr:lysophospholipase [Xylaria intraflava]